jgi:hypothetical protein
MLVYIINEQNVERRSDMYISMYRKINLIINFLKIKTENDEIVMNMIAKKKERTREHLELISI